MRESKTSSSLPCDTWYVGPYLLPTCLFCVSTKATPRGHILTFKIDNFPAAGEWICLSIVYKTKTTMISPVVAKQAGSKIQQNQSSVLMLKERRGHSSLMLIDSKLKRGFIWLNSDMRDWVSWPAPGFAGQSCYCLHHFPHLQKKKQWRTYACWSSYKKKVRKYSSFTPWFHAMVLDNHETRHDEFL